MICMTGQGFLIEPEVQTFYQADRNEPWFICGLVFRHKGRRISG